MSPLKILLEDTDDLGELSDAEDKAAYEQAVANAIREQYPEADVTVSCAARSRARALVTTRDADGRILYDEATAREESSIEYSCLEIARSVWDAGDFWPTREVQS